MVHATAFLGANMIGNGITFFASAGIYGSLGIQIASIVVFGAAGHYVQHKLGYDKCHEEKLKAEADNGKFLEHKDESNHA
jgi:hypothetical protein